MAWLFVPDAVIITGSSVSNPLLLGVQNSSVANSYLMFLFQSQMSTPVQLEQTERVKLLGGRKSLACPESPGPDEKSD